MVDQFSGTWKLTHSENFEDYMKAIGVSAVIRKMGLTVKPKFIVSVGDDGAITMKTKSALKSTEITFKLDEEFDEKTADERLTKTIISFTDGKLVQTQTWDGKSTTLERTLQDDKLITTCKVGDVVSVRTYEREA
ncbi:hypothetical protein CRUP_034631 [Coryphaenoides rupestris]|nr:hypothetical protein CRUP_034631 [Coryphaenoides rupestris]